MDHRLRIMSFPLFASNWFFKIQTDIEFLISYYSIDLPNKKVLLKNVVLDKRGLIIEADTDLKG